ncbi:MAG: hypothetical protein IV093_07520 [Rubrivivax sp.]|nr:hypothetical protein [Rubrivivax sp.]
MRPSRPSLSIARLAAPAAALTLTLGCSILQPLPSRQDNRRFPLHTGGQVERAHVPCVPKDAHDTRCAALAIDIDGFHGGLGRAMWEADEWRRELVTLSVERTNLNTAYNALLWPLGSFFLAKKVREPAWRTIDTVAFATATYGLLNAGIPERDKIYARVATRMACAMAEAEAEVYPQGLAPDDGGPGLLALNAALARAITDHAQARTRVLLSLHLKPKAPVQRGQTEVQRTRLSAIGQGGAPVPLPDPTQAFTDSTAALMKKANDEWAAATRLARELGGAGTRLRQRRGTLNSALEQALAGRAAEPRNPFDAAREIAQAFEQGIAAERRFVSRATGQSGAAPATAWVPTPARLAGLTVDSAQAVKDFWLHEQARLEQQAALTAHWRTQHAARVLSARNHAADLGCTEGDLGGFTAELLRRATDSAAGAASSASSTPQVQVTPIGALR